MRCDEDYAEEHIEKLEAENAKLREEITRLQSLLYQRNLAGSGSHPSLLDNPQK